MELIYSLEELPAVAEQLLAIGKPYPVWAFDAPMGAGKTTLIGQICRQLNIKDAISSPTFSIINQYISPEGQRICHMDWYRIKDEEEAIRTGVEDALYDHDLTFVEWPEKALKLLPENTLFIKIMLMDNEKRKIETKQGDRR